MLPTVLPGRDRGRAIDVRAILPSTAVALLVSLALLVATLLTWTSPTPRPASDTPSIEGAVGGDASLALSVGLGLGALADRLRRRTRPVPAPTVRIWIAPESASELDVVVATAREHARVITGAAPPDAAGLAPGRTTERPRWLRRFDELSGVTPEAPPDDATWGDGWDPAPAPAPGEDEVPAHTA